MGTTATRPGFAMLLVMILIAVGVILGMSYLATASLRVNVSHNLQLLARARYLAESGLEHAMYTIRYAPEQLDGSDIHPRGPYYVDDSPDSYTISAAPYVDEPGKYLVTCTAAVGNVRRTSSTTVYRSAGARLGLRQGVLVGAGFVWLPWRVDLKGDFHVNGFLLNTARIDGDASATHGLWDPWGRITGTVNGSADPVDVPRITHDQYRKYDFGGTEYKAELFTKTDLTANDPLADGGAVTASNPAGVVYLKPKSGNTVRLNRNLNFTGTLVIDGDVILDGRNIDLTAVDGFPAIVASGAVFVTNAARNVTMNGLVASRMGVLPLGRTNASSTTINGALVADFLGYGAGLNGRHTVNYERDRASIFDMSMDPALLTPSVEVLTWND